MKKMNFLDKWWMGSSKYLSFTVVNGIWEVAHLVVVSMKQLCHLEKSQLHKFIQYSKIDDRSQLESSSPGKARCRILKSYPLWDPVFFWIASDKAKYSEDPNLYKVNCTISCAGGGAELAKKSIENWPWVSITEASGRLPNLCSATAFI